MDLYIFVIPLGILTLVLLTLTILMGLRVIRVKFRIHRLFGILTFISALLHAGLVVYLTYFE
ncbi:MAG: hypothetical protein KKA81_13875 [Bacteroidetes bacterium]|nr:hypothetical protein [Bacteroidota bacterium]